MTNWEFSEPAPLCKIIICIFTDRTSHVLNKSRIVPRTLKRKDHRTTNISFFYKFLNLVFTLIFRLFRMSLNGKWKQVNSVGGLEFGQAIGATAEQLEQGKQTKTDLEYKVSGNTITATRTYTSPGYSILFIII